jgi:hypothetical protein
MLLSQVINKSAVDKKQASFITEEKVSLNY